MLGRHAAAIADCELAHKCKAMMIGVVKKTAPGYLERKELHHKKTTRMFCAPSGRGVTVRLGVGLGVCGLAAETRDRPLEYANI